MSDNFVRMKSSMPMAPPADVQGVLGWVREKLFATPLSSMLTLLAILLIAWIIPDLFRFAITDAVWSAEDGKACRAPGAGACWAYVRTKISFFVYGLYPRDQVWRVDVVLALGAVLVTWLLWPDAKGRKIAAILFFLAYPVLAFGLLTGHAPFPSRWIEYVLGPRVFPVLLAGVAVLTWMNGNKKTAIACLALCFFLALGVVMPQFIDVLTRIAPKPLAWLVGTARVVFFLYLVAAILVLALVTGRMTLAGTCAGLLIWYGVGRSWGTLELPVVGTHLWGGVFVSLLVATIGIVFSLPLGIVLALGRRSQMPVVRFCSIVFIEFIRGVPLITILFMANFMLPLFVPQEWSPDRLLRPLIGVALFASAYMAEVVRGGLQAIPRGQYEGAMAVGLNWSQMTRLVVLPQALVLVIPGIVNSFIALFKDTTLVAVAGVFDFLKAIEAQRDDPLWAGPTISATGYLFAAIFYFAFCFGMSRYSMMMEKRLSAGREH